MFKLNEARIERSKILLRVTDSFNRCTEYYPGHAGRALKPVSGLRSWVMPNVTQSGIFVPILPSSLDETICSVDVDLPAEVEAELRSYAERDGNSWTAQAERALILYHEKFLREPDEKAKTIAWVIQQLNELAPPRPPKKLSARQKESHLARKKAAIAELRTEGFAGNLVLKWDLFEFVRRAVDDGTFSSASEMVIAALPLLRTKRIE